MSRAVQGTQYTVVQGDNLTTIASAAYGDPKKWKVIWNANQTRLRSGDPNLIFPGEVITIPRDTLEQSLKQDLRDQALVGKDKNAFTLEVEGIEVNITSGRVLRTMDTVADGWSASLSRDTGDKRLQKLLRPYRYPVARAYLGGVLMVSGYLYTVSPSVEAEARSQGLAGWSFTADVIDSTVKPPYEKKKVSLKQRAEDLVGHLGIEVLYEADEDEIFKRVTAKPQDGIAAHLLRLSAQRGLLMSSTPKGQLIFYRTQSGQQPVGTIEEGKFPFLGMAAEFDGRKRFNVYKAIAQTRKKKKKVGTAKDDVVPKSRFLTFTANEATAGNIQNAADWRRSKQVADALTIPLSIEGWYAPNGQLWRENTLVTVISPTNYIDKGFDFLIRSAEFSLTDKGTTTTLQLVPPQVYTGEALVEPWLED
ncbi:LysM peptidoglycan-binding domain-containing protein [Candidatus Pacearchaeota archaeon]|nr:LysM peptidoglycan-binding domain-containing protein [Candidatus Pacearchaeota archaeon]